MEPSRLDSMQALLERTLSRLRVLTQGRVRNFPMYVPLIEGKRGLEIGGPSRIFQPGNACPLYNLVESLDNCDFSIQTTWAQHKESYKFTPRKPAGKSFFCEGSNLATISDSCYDFVLSSHNLEHFANPVKALREWMRVLRPGGALVLVLPDYRKTFDHERKPTSVEHMLDDFHRSTGEDDLTHLAEILEKHDLSMDREAGSKEQLYARSLNNLSNRCLHHHVFDEQNSSELLSQLGFDVLACDLALPFHICLLANLQ